MSTTAPSVATPASFGCNKWADCSCAASSPSCGCGAKCGCGNVSVEAVTAAMASQTTCALGDCSCGAGCKCGRDCKCGGTRQKTLEEWVQTVKMTGTGCSCTKVDGKCACGSACACGGTCA